VDALLIQILVLMLAAEEVAMANVEARTVGMWVDQGFYPQSLEARVQSCSEWNIHHRSWLEVKGSRFFKSTSANLTILKISCFIW
jgi:hypothetical protein